MKVRNSTFVRCMALLLCVVMVAALLPVQSVNAAFPLETPVLSSAKKSGNAIKVTWKPVTGASNYRVYRMGPSDSNWKALGNTTGTSYTDSNVKNGVTYKYTVRCISKDGKTFTSGYNASGISCTYWSLGTPSITSATVVSNGIKVTWGAVSGAAKYRLYRKTTGSWTKVTDTTATSYTDVSCQPGTTYTYTVRCITADGKTWTSNFNATGKTVTFTGALSITGLEPVAGGIKVTWSKTGAASYRVTRNMGSGEKFIGNFTGTTFTDTDVTSGMTYTYTIQGYASDGTTKMGSPATKSLRYFDTPELEPDVIVSGSNLTVKWLAVPGAPAYRVFRRTSTSSWAQIANITGTSYTDTTAASGVTYFYTVRVVSAANTSGVWLSGFDAAGVSGSYVGAPTLVSTEAGNSGIVFKWNTVGTIRYYQIYRKTASTSWQPYPTSAGRVTVAAGAQTGTFTDSSVIQSTKYFYTVACCDSSFNVISVYNTTGLGCTLYGTPVLGTPTVVANGVKVTWNVVDGITKYRVFRKEQTGTVWKGIATVSGTSYIDTGVTSGGTYIYTVRSMTADGQSYASGYNTTGKTITFYAAPALKSATVTAVVTSGTGSVRFIWKDVPGITYYNLYRKVSGGAWTRIATANTGTHTGDGYLYYDDVPPASGKTYIYTARCCDSGGNFLSYFVESGVSTYFMTVPTLMSPIVAKGAITVR